MCYGSHITVVVFYKFSFGQIQIIFVLSKKKLTQLFSQDVIVSYIINHYNPSVRIIDPDSHTTFVVFVKFYTWVAGSTV